MGSFYSLFSHNLKISVLSTLSLKCLEQNSTFNLHSSKMLGFCTLSSQMRTEQKNILRFTARHLENMVTQSRV